MSIRAHQVVWLTSQLPEFYFLFEKESLQSSDFLFPLRSQKSWGRSALTCLSACGSSRMDLRIRKKNAQVTLQCTTFDQYISSQSSCVRRNTKQLNTCTLESDQVYFQSWLSHLPKPGISTPSRGKLFHNTGSPGWLSVLT